MPCIQYLEDTRQTCVLISFDPVDRPVHGKWVGHIQHLVKSCFCCNLCSGDVGYTNFYCQMAMLNALLR